MLIQSLYIQLPNPSNSEQLDLDDFQIKKCDEGDDSPTMPKFNVQLNHIDRSKQQSEQSEQINPFQVNLRSTGANLVDEEPREIDQGLNGHTVQQSGKFANFQWQKKLF